MSQFQISHFSREECPWGIPPFPPLLFPPPPFYKGMMVDNWKTNSTVNHTKMCSARVINYPVSDQKVYILISEIVFSTLVFNLP